MTIHVQHIDAARHMVKARVGTRMDVDDVPNCHDFALGFGATGRIVDVGNQKALNAFTQAHNFIAAGVAETGCYRNIIVQNTVASRGGAWRKEDRHEPIKQLSGNIV